MVVLDFLDRARIHSLHDVQLPGIVLPVSFSLLGAIIVSRQPGNRVGWIYLLIGVLMPCAGAERPLLRAERACRAAYPVEPGRRGWTTGCRRLVFPAGLSLFAFLLFPTGRLPSPRWRFVVWSGLAASLDRRRARLVRPDADLGLLGSAEGRQTRSGSPRWGRRLTSAIGARGLRSSVSRCLTATIVSLVRARSAGGSTGAPAGEAAGLRRRADHRLPRLVVPRAARRTTDSGAARGTRHRARVRGGGAGRCGLAILKHGLFEIDRLISRTVSYAILTGLLVGLFLGIVALATDVLPFSSPVAVAASTLAAAALFNPLRLRVQKLVDRRFNRARYDAEAIVTAFTMRLRDAVDLDTVRRELLVAVDGAVQPTHASVWIRPRSRA